MNAEARNEPLYLVIGLRDEPRQPAPHYRVYTLFGGESASQGDDEMDGRPVVIIKRGPHTVNAAEGTLLSVHRWAGGARKEAHRLNEMSMIHDS